MSDVELPGRRKRRRPQRRFVDVVKEDMQKVRMIEDDANDKVRWKWIHYSGQPKKEVCTKVI